MKLHHIVLAILASTSTLAFASAQPANFFVCRGDNIELQYSSTSKTGEAQFSVTTTADEQSWTTPLANIHTENTALGKLVTGFDPYIADATRTYSLPTSNVLVGNDVVTFDTMLIETFQGGFFVPSEPLPGALVQSTYTPVTCEAQFVLF